jgi:parvulin-like peptidyl-prolyl isomerase
MSIRNIQQRFAVRLRYVLYALIAVFVVGLPFVFTPGLRAPNRDEGTPKEAQDTIARVNGQPLARSRFDQRFSQTVTQLLPLYASMGQSVTLSQLGRFRLQAFDQAVLDELVLRQAAAEGISASRGEISQEAERNTDQELEQIKASYKGDQLELMLGGIVAQTEGKQPARMSERSFRKWAIDRLLGSASDQLRDQIVVGKLRQRVTGKVSVTEQDLMASYDQVSAREIAVSLHPTGKPARTEEEARKRAEDLLAKIKQGADFAALARTESDDPGAKTTGGLRPSLPLSAMPPEWQKAVSALKPGEVSPAIKTPTGYTIVKVESRTRQLPKDFERNKQQLLKNLAEQRQSQAWRDYSLNLQQKAKVEVLDPEILGYRELAEGKEKEGLASLRKATTESGHLQGLAAAALYYQIASLQAGRNQWKEAADSYSAAVDAAAQEQKTPLPGARAEALMGLAQANEHLSKPAEAMVWYQEASNWSDTPTIHQQLTAVYQRLGKPDLVKKEQDWLVEYQKQQAEREKAMLEQQTAPAASRNAVVSGGPSAGGAPKQVPAPPPSRPAPGAPAPTRGPGR